jgi:cell wall-associated NlpC family hydrolase
MTSKKARPVREGDPDPRINLYRSDMAAESLRPIFAADRYVPGALHQIAMAVAPSRAEGHPNARLGSEVLFGETVAVYETKDDWAWIQATLDDYVGYVPSSCLGEALSAAPVITHNVAVLSSFVFPEPDLKTSPLIALPMNGQVQVIGEHKGYSELASGGWMYSKHLAAVGAVAPDYVATARLYLGVPYLWGGRSGLGLDCSGLVQTVLLRAGIKAPRDSDLQLVQLGAEVPLDAYPDALKRGDLIFFPSHVGIMDDGEYLIHANALSMNVARQPLAEFVEILEAKLGTAITGIRRLQPDGVPATAGRRRRY